jgi:aldehyde:ferredoxin oxidoreductase
MGENPVSGYAGKLLRVDLTGGRCDPVTFGERTLRQWIGGAGLGARILYDEVPPSVHWDDPENRLILASGPLGGTRVAGSGTFCAVTVGAMTDGSTSTQANGFLGAYMKSSGYDGLIFQGRSDNWVYLYLHDGVAELRDATHLLGLDTWETQSAIGEELGKKERAISVFGIGPAGEKLVRFAALVGDHGHVAAHNGVGAVMGSKRLKAVVAARGPRLRLADEKGHTEAAKRLMDAVLADPAGHNTFEWGTSQSFGGAAKLGYLPVKNLTTNLFPQWEDFLGANYRPSFQTKTTPCWACQSNHIHMLTIPDGPYAGFQGEEPEYEQWSEWGPLIGNTDVAATVVLANEVDRLGMDNNETGWLMAWVLECYGRGILTKEDTGGLEMTWGNVEAIRGMLHKIAHREGIGDLLAEGVKRASEKLGRGSQEFAVYTMKGNSPRGHDHRARWSEMLETCLSDTGTLMVGPVKAGGWGKMNLFDWEGMSGAPARHAGWMIFEDCLGVCRFCTRGEPTATADALVATTGWDFSLDEAMRVGRRTIHLLRAFNLRRGFTPAMEYPSQRYWSTPVDGPAAGQSIASHWEEMRANFYRLIGWDLETGRPLPETLEAVGLSELVPVLWGNSH